jgi:hypothetical protein
MKAVKPLASLAVIASLLFIGATSAHAAPFNAENNPNILDVFFSGIHTIVGEQGDIHTGWDVVMKAGNSGNIQQWFLGESTQEGYHGDHSLWRLSSDGTCKNNEIEVSNAYPGWGTYLEPGATYCVKTNDFH